MFCVALSTSVLMSCSSDDDDDSPKGGDKTFKSLITISSDVLAIYDNVTVYYKFADGTEVPQSVTDTSIKFEQQMAQKQDVVVRFTGTLREDVVKDDQQYDMNIRYAGVYEGVNRGSSFKTNPKSGLSLKEKCKQLGDVSGFKQHTYAFTQPLEGE